MKKINKLSPILEKIQVTEHPEDNTWELSFIYPAYQCDDTFFVDEKTAKEILSIKHQKNSKKTEIYIGDDTSLSSAISTTKV